jgi:hypothetical protein
LEGAVRLHRPQPIAGPSQAELYCGWREHFEQELDDPADENIVGSYWNRYLSASSRAFRHLQAVDLWTYENGGRDETIGLTFQDWPYVPGGWEVLAVHCDDELAVSLLQHRLNQLGADTALVLKD